MARPKPTEVRLVRDMLCKEEWEDEEECAKAILTRLAEKRGKQGGLFCLAVQYRTSEKSVITQLYGPYATRGEAERAYRKGVGQGGEDGQVAVFPLVTPEQAAEAMDQ